MITVAKFCEKETDIFPRSRTSRSGLMQTRPRQRAIVYEGIHQEVRVTSGQKLCTEMIYIILQTSVRLF